MRLVLLVVNTLLGLLIGAADASGQARSGSSPWVDPYTSRSPDGQYVLEVDPQDRLARGPGRHRLRRKAELVATCDRPWTFFEAAVTNEGLVAGYAYVGSTQGGEPTEVVVALLAPDGSTRLEQRFDRDSLGGPAHGLPVRGVFAQPELDRFVVRLPHFEEGALLGEQWWIWPLSGGETRTVEAIGSRFDDIAGVPGTPLVVARKGWIPSSDLELWDERRRVVWREAGAPSTDGYRSSRLPHALKRQRAARAGSAPGTFDVLTSDGEQRSFLVERDPSSASAWKVRETARRAVSIPPDSPPAVRPEPLLLRDLAIVQLGGGDVPGRSVVGALLAYEFTSEGRIDIVRAEPVAPRRFSWVRIDLAGNPSSERLMPPFPSDVGREVHWARDGIGRWVALVQSSRTLCRVWRFDPDHAEAEGQLEPFAELEVGVVLDLEAFTDGGFVVLAGDPGAPESEARLHAFASDGRREWSVTDGAEGPGRARAIATTRDDEVVALDAEANALSWFDRRGAHVRTVAIVDELGLEPDRAVNVVADPRGGLLVLDADRSDLRFWRVAADGAIRVDVRPTSVERRWSSASNAEFLRVAPDGTTWTSDRSTIYEVEENGSLRRWIGKDPYREPPRRACEIEVDPQGRIVVLHVFSQRVEVFDRGGRRLFECLPAAGDPPLPSPALAGGEDRIVAEADGSILRATAEPEAIRWDAGGARAGRTPWMRRRDSALAASGRWMLAAGSKDVVLHGATEALSSTRIRRRPDGRWLRNPTAIAASARGALAILDDRSAEGFPAGPVLAIYDPEGKPERTIALPPHGFSGRLARDERWAAYPWWGDTKLVLVDLASGRVTHTELDSFAEGPQRWDAFLPAGENELWLIEASSLVLRRCALPE